MTPLLLLHGFAGAPAAWDAVRAQLGARPALAPALAGHDGTPPPASFEAEVDRLAALVVSAGFGGAILAGYSLGGRLAAGLLARHASLFSAALLISTHAGLGAADAAARDARAAGDERWASLLEREGAAAFADAWGAQPLFATQRALPPERLTRQRAMRAAHEPRALAAALRAFSPARMPDLRAAVAAAAGARPITLLAGAEDSRYAQTAVELAARWPGARARVLHACGHNLLLERPVEVAAAVKELS